MYIGSHRHGIMELLLPFSLDTPLEEVSGLVDLSTGTGDDQDGSEAGRDVSGVVVNHQVRGVSAAEFPRSNVINPLSIVAGFNAIENSISVIQRIINCISCSDDCSCSGFDHSMLQDMLSHSSRSSEDLWIAFWVSSFIFL